jgi:hypothetical protein
VTLTLALNKVLAQWAEGSSRDPLILLFVTFLLGLVRQLPVPGRRGGRCRWDPMTALRYE